MTTLTSDGLSRYTGIPQQCLNGGWVSLCTIGTIDANIPSLVCKELGYNCKITVYLIIKLHFLRHIFPFLLFQLVKQFPLIVLSMVSVHLEHSTTLILIVLELLMLAIVVAMKHLLLSVLMAVLSIHYSATMSAVRRWSIVMFCEPDFQFK